MVPPLSEFKYLPLSVFQKSLLRLADAFESVKSDHFDHLLASVESETIQEPETTKVLLPVCQSHVLGSYLQEVVGIVIKIWR